MTRNYLGSGGAGQMLYAWDWKGEGRHKTRDTRVLDN